MLNKNLKNNKRLVFKTDSKGIALFVAVLITSVALLFSYAISNIAVKELTLTQAGRDSQIAFYASNTGIECALFWDLRKNYFDPTQLSLGSITCNGQPAPITSPSHNYPISSRSFNVGPIYLVAGETDGPCFELFINKMLDTTNNVITTRTESRGYNTCNASSRRLERALRATY